MPNATLSETVEIPNMTPLVKARRFQDRVDQAAKALRRGTWGRRFEACFEEGDGGHVAAALIRRAETKPDLQEAIIKAFRVRSWEQVPWHKGMRRFEGMGAREIGLDAERARLAADRVMKEGLTFGSTTSD